MLTQRHYTILIVDDLQDNRDMYRCYLTTDSDIAYTILEAKSAKDTLTLCRALVTGSDRSTLDVILLKSNLSDGDGLEILTTLKGQLGASCPPVVMIDGDNIALAVRAIKGGAEDYLVHAQITPEQLRFTIKSAIENGEQRRILHNEERTAKLEATLQSYYDNAPMMMGVVELTENDIIHIYDNGATCHFFGTTLNSTTGKLASELGVAPAVIQKWLGYYRESQEQQKPVQFEYVHSDGTKHPQLVN